MRAGFRSHIKALQVKNNRPTPVYSPPIIHGNQPNILDSLDLSLSLDKKLYNEQLNHYQGKLNKLARQAHEKKSPVF